MTRPATPLGMADRRGLGWDISSRYSSNRGDLFGTGSYGHTGFTGTSIWIDPTTQTVVIFLSNRVHPDGTGDVVALRGRVATLAAAAVEGVPLVSEGSPRVTTGIDRLRGEAFARLDGQRVGLLTNQSGRSSSGSTTIDLLHDAPNVDLRRLFSPEHGIRGDRDARVPDAVDPVTGLTVHSLYGDSRRPAPAALDGVDTIVVDLQGRRRSLLHLCDDDGVCDGGGGGAERQSRGPGSAESDQWRYRRGAPSRRGPTGFHRLSLDAGQTRPDSR